jgi:hypothetical protein
LSFPAFNFSGGIAASGEDFGVFAGPSASFEAPRGGFAMPRESVFCGGLFPPDELRSAMG